MSISEVDKCYLCELIGDFDEFKDIKEKFDAQHECWNQQQYQDSSKKVKSPQNSKRKSENEKAHEINETIELKKNNYCDECYKNFCSEKYLEIHKKNVHEKRKDDKCDMCTVLLLRQHKKMVHGGKKITINVSNARNTLANKVVF